MKHILQLLLPFLLISNSLFAQENFQIRTIAFYNLENLFDTVNDTLKNDEASPIMGSFWREQYKVC